MKSLSKFCAVFVIVLSKIEWSVEQVGHYPSRMKQFIRPKRNENEPVEVDLSMFIRSIESIDEKNLEMNVQVVFCMSWLDTRLAFKHLDYERSEIDTIEMNLLTNSSTIWIPDVYFPNEKRYQEYNLIIPNSHIRIFPNGTVLFTKRILLTLNCPMNLKYYPHDSQLCQIRITTYHSNINYVLLQWKPHDPIQLAPNISLPKFTLDRYRSSGNLVKTTTDKFSLLTVDLIFIREFFPYFKKLYLPVVIVVLISWIPLWLERVLILRIHIAMSTVIFLGWFYTVQDDIGSYISYNTALNTWNAANFIFVLLAALESMGIVFMIKTNTNAIKRTHPDDNNEFKMLPYGPDKRKVLEIVDEESKSNIDAEIMKIKSNFKICFINVHKETQIIDAVAKLFFPSAYVLFLFFYWITYINNEQVYT